MKKFSKSQKREPIYEYRGMYAVMTYGLLFIIYIFVVPNMRDELYFFPDNQILWDILGRNMAIIGAYLFFAIVCTFWLHRYTLVAILSLILMFITSLMLDDIEGAGTAYGLNKVANNYYYLYSSIHYIHTILFLYCIYARFRGRKHHEQSSLISHH